MANFIFNNTFCFPPGLSVVCEKVYTTEVKA